MSRYREAGHLDQNDTFMFEDYEIVTDLMRPESGKLNEREKLALTRLYRTYQYMID